MFPIYFIYPSTICTSPSIQHDILQRALDKSWTAEQVCFFFHFFFHRSASAARSVLKSCSSDGLPEVSDRRYRVFRWQRFWPPNGVFVCTIRLRSWSEPSIKLHFVKHAVHIDHRLSFISKKERFDEKGPVAFTCHSFALSHVSIVKSYFKPFRHA